jgi:hypothetical protein
LHHVDSTSTLVTRFTPSHSRPSCVGVHSTAHHHISPTAIRCWQGVQAVHRDRAGGPAAGGRVQEQGVYERARACVWVCLRAFLSSSAARVECETASPSVGGSHVVRERLHRETFHNSTLLATSSQCVAGHLTAPPSPMFLRGEDEDTSRAPHDPPPPSLGR